MDQGLVNASVAMLNKMKNIQVVANNLANVNTNGFKRGLAFSEVFNEEQANLQRELTDFTEGVFMETDNPLNAALSGKVFFAVNTPDGEQITKNGNFTIDDEGYLATRDGDRVLGDNGEINLNDELINKKSNIVITKNGELKSDDRVFAKLRIVKVEDELGLVKAGGQKYFNAENYYISANDNEFQVHHGFLESSNTNAIIEMQAMIQLQKDYEAAQKMITSIDSTLSQANEIGKV